MSLDELLSELENLGNSNDALQTDKTKKYLNITRDTGEFLSVLVKATSALNILEIGTSNGYSALWLASSLPESGHLYTIECMESKVDAALENFKRAGLSSKITLLRGDVANELDNLPFQFDMIFLDADRSQYLLLAEKLFGLLKPGGLIICDNALSHEGEFKEFVSWVKLQPDLSISIVPVGKGELLIYKGKQ